MKTTIEKLTNEQLILELRRQLEIANNKIAAIQQMVADLEAVLELRVKRDLTIRGTKK